MSANIQPIFTKTPVLGRVRIAAANAARDGSGTLNNIKAANNTTDFQGAADGTRIDSITFRSAQATPAANSAMVGRVFISDSTGSNWRLLEEIAITNVTASNTAIGATATITFSNGLIVPAGCKIAATQSVYAGVQDQMDVIMRGGDFN